MKQGLQVFDIHAHIFPDHVAGSVIEHLQDLSGMVAAYDGTRQGLIDSMTKAGYDGALNCPIATKPEQVDSINRWVKNNDQWPVLSLGAVHPFSDNKKAILSDLMASGIRGIKLHPEFQEFFPLDEVMAPVWEFCSENQFLVLMHTGNDAGFQTPPKCTPEPLVELIDKYPDLTLIAAHFGSWRRWDEVDALLIGKKVYLDLAFTLGLYDNAKLVSMIRRHGVDYVLYGTDTPWRDQGEYLEAFFELPLTREEQKKILWDNARRLLGFG